MLKYTKKNASNLKRQKLKEMSTTPGACFFVSPESLPVLSRRAMQKKMKLDRYRQNSSEEAKKRSRFNMATNVLKCVMFDEFFNDSADESDFSDGEEDTNALLLAVLPFLNRDSHVRVQKYVQSVVGSYTEYDFRRMFRLTRESFQDLCQILSTCPEMQVRDQEFGGRDRVTLEKTVLLSLRYLGHQGYIRLVSDVFDVADSTVVKCRYRVVSALLGLKDTYIRWPTSEQNKQRIDRKFEEKGGFPDVLGAIDGTHIQIHPPDKHSQSYVSRKAYHSLILQAVCMPDMTFSNCYCEWPGSVHDSRVLRNSDLWDEGLMACGGRHILGDGAYPIKNWLLTPYRDNGHLTAQEKRYNYIHSSTRCVIERAFGLLKGRFRRLHFKEAKQLQTACDIILICCILHNFCISRGDFGEDFVEDLGNIEAQHPILYAGNVNDDGGAVKKDRIARNLH